jgi:hypothetical protein
MIWQYPAPWMKLSTRKAAEAAGCCSGDAGTKVPLTPKGEFCFPAHIAHLTNSIIYTSPITYVDVPLAETLTFRFELFGYLVSMLSVLISVPNSS